MTIDMDQNPKEALTVLIATGLLIFKPVTPASACELAEALIAEVERRYGKLNP